MTKKNVLTGLVAWLAIVGLITVACGGGDDSSKKVTKKTNKPAGEGSDEEPADEPAPKPTPKPGDYAVVAVENGGTLKGAVVWVGDVPTAELSYEYTSAKDDAEVCAGGGTTEGGKRKNGRLQLGDRGAGKKGVAHVVVWIEATEGAALLKAPGEVVVDNKNCEFSPLIQLIGINPKIVVKNSDTTTHNTKGKFTPWGGEVDELFNENLKGGNSATATRTAEKAGQLKLQCDQHYWMEGYAIVQNHPYYAMTDALGCFEIGTAIKAGKYTVHFWHAGYKLKRDADGKMKGYDLPLRWKKADVEIKAGANDLAEVEYGK